MRSIFVSTFVFLIGCAAPASRPAAPPPNYGYGYSQPYPQQQPYPSATPYPNSTPAPYPQQPPANSQPLPTPARPLLAPLAGDAAWQAEARAILAELIEHLDPNSAVRVRGIPMVFNPDPTDVNAFAGCDDSGHAYMAGTEGLLEAVDAIAQTRATDELYGTQTYAAYVQAIIPKLLATKPGPAALPLGIIPAQYVLLPQRLSRAHEIWDDVIAFTFGHELAHHYLGHTGCAVGSDPAFAAVGRIFSNLGPPSFNQLNEVAADNNGMINVLNTGRARRPNFEWTERGGLTLLTFFDSLEKASGQVIVSFLLSHPNSAFRMTILQGAASIWHSQHP